MVRYITSLFILGTIIGCHTSKTSSADVSNAQTISEKAQSPVQFAAGIPAYNETSYRYKRGNKELATITFKEPVVVSVAEKPEKWGFFQFPNIGRDKSGNIAVKWNLAADAIESYGVNHFGSAVSNDGGKSWTIKPTDEFPEFTELPNGDLLTILTPKPIKVEELKLPPAIGRGQDTYARQPYSFYKLHDLPESRQGVFQKRLEKGTGTWKEEQAPLHDPRAARYTFRGLFPVLFWGDLRVAKDNSVIAGIYPGFYIGDDGIVSPKSGVFFYRSDDNAKTWKIQGRILYDIDTKYDSLAYKRMGFTEPAFDIMPDGSFLTISRTTDGIGMGPMFTSRSTDQGKTWSRPVAMAPSGVLPRLITLENGVTVLSSGRPGVQLRFSTDGKGQTWTDPFEMLPYKDSEGNVNVNSQVSCGYTGLIPTGPDRFLIVYSDFKFETPIKEIRKAIKVREIIVKR